MTMTGAIVICSLSLCLSLLVRLVAWSVLLPNKDNGGMKRNGRGHWKVAHDGFFP